MRLPWKSRVRPREVFFLCGFGKSGTNWVGNLLNLHPHVLCDGEWQFQHFFHAWETFARHPWQLGSRQPARRVARAGVERLIRECLETMVASKPGASLLGDRSPRPLVPIVRGARTIYVFRDGRDVLVSFTYHHLRAGTGAGFPDEIRGLFAGFQREFAAEPDAFGPDRPGLLGEEAWVRETSRFWGWRVLQDLERGREMPAGTLHRVRYEDLHADVARACREMYEFLGVDPDAADPPSTETRTLPGFDREDRRSLYRKGEAGAWRAYSSPAFDRWVREEAGEALDALGYSW